MERLAQIELTGLAAFNHVLREAQACSQPWAVSAELCESAQRLDEELGQLVGRAFDHLACRELDPQRQHVLEALDGVLPTLHRGLRSLLDALSVGDMSAAVEALAELGDVVQVVVESDLQLRSIDEGEPVCSESAPVDELCRTGRAFLRGKVSWEAFGGRVRWFESYFAQLCAGLALLQPAGRENAVAEAARDRIAEALQDAGEALGRLVRALECEDDREVAGALEMLVSSADVLCAFQRGLEEATSVSASVLCLRCGCGNGVGVRTCRQCQASLPRLTLHVEEPSALDVRETADASLGLPSRIQEVVARVRGWQAGALSPEALRVSLQEHVARVAAARQHLARMVSPPPETPPEQMAAYREARAALEAGSDALEEHLRALEQAVVDGDLQVDGLLARLSDDVAMLRQVDQIWQEMLAACS